MFVDEQTVHAHGGTPVSTKVLDQSDHSIHWKECITCSRIKPFGEFKRDSSYREGVRDQCLVCESAPRLSTQEHTIRQKEMNYRAANAQRWDNQEDYENDAARVGMPMHHSELLRRIRKLIPHNLFVMDGRIVGDLAIYRVYGTPQPDLNGRTFRYLFYIPTGWMPEFSQYEFDSRDVPIKESKRGWRTPLLRLIKTGLVSEDQVRDEFGEALGEASVVWHRELQKYRTSKINPVSSSD